jgi:hypothetical protein
MRAHLIDVGGFLCVACLFLGIGCAFLLPGKEWAAFVGTLPGIAYLVAAHFIDWSSHA